MNVLILSTTQGKGYGAESVLRHLLRGWRNPEIRLHVACPPGSAVEECSRIHGHTVYPFPIRSNHFGEHLQKTFRLRKELKGKRFDVVHGWTAREFELTLLLRRSGVATSTLHDHPNADFHSGSRRALMRFTANRLHSTACVSKAVWTACRKVGYTGRLDILHNGLCDDVPASKEAHPGVEELRIGFLGLYANWKGFDIIRPWLDHRFQRPVHWYLYGKPTASNLRLIGHLPANCTLAGWKEPEEIWRHTDVLVHASTCFDPFPTVLLEAGRAGVACVASQLGGSGEIIDNAQTGYLFDPSLPEKGLESLARLIEKPDVRLEMAKQARIKYEACFKAAHMAERYATFWQGQVLDARDPGDSSK